MSACTFTAYVLTVVRTFQSRMTGMGTGLLTAVFVVFDCHSIRVDRFSSASLLPASLSLCTPFNRQLCTRPAVYKGWNNRNVKVLSAAVKAVLLFGVNCARQPHHICVLLDHCSLCLPIPSTSSKIRWHIVPPSSRFHQMQSQAQSPQFKHNSPTHFDVPM